jgi:hypothetical protein
LVLDTSAVLAFLNRSDPNHKAIAKIVMESDGLLIPVGILAEIAYLVEHRLGSRTLDLFFEDILKANFGLDCGLDDLAEIRQLVKRYDNLPLGYADAAVMTCARRTASGVLSLDRRDFEIVRRELGFVLLP